MKKIVFLVSGNGGTLKFIYHAIRVLKIELEITGVIADRECGALRFGMSKGIESKILQISKKDQTALNAYLSDKKVDIVITNIFKILNKQIIEIDKINFLNLHYSLLPAYAGLIGMKTVEMASNDRARFIGATCHKVVEKVDAGKILGQCILKTDWKTKNPQDYYNIIFRGANFILLNQLIRNISNIVKTEEYKDLIFNPGLTFDVSKFDEAFWKKIK